MIGLKIDGRSIQQIGRLVNKLRRFHDEMEHRKPAHRRIRDRIASRWAMNFDSQGSLYGGWEPTHQATIDHHGAPVKTLLRTGTLRSGFIAQAKAGQVTDNATVWNFGRNPVYIFTQHFGDPNNTAYARAFRFGPIPSRPLWGINAEDEQIAQDEMEQYIDRVIARYF